MQHKYVHLGSSSFDNTLFQPIKNISGFTKPTGGFWGSPVNSDYGWGEWVKSNNFDELIGSNKYEKEKFYFKLKPNTRLLYINKASMLRDLPKQEDEFTLACSSFIVLDFKELEKTYDAIEVNISSDRQLYWDLYGWDVDSILILNPDCVIEC